jgi:hypothetical protein
VFQKVGQFVVGKCVEKWASWEVAAYWTMLNQMMYR